VKITTRTLVIAAMMLAVTILLGQLPVGGFIPIPGTPVRATTLHIPTILAGILGGPVAGLLTGLGFGVSSMLRAAQLADPVFTDPIVAIIPRLFIGVLAWLGYNWFRRINETVGIVAGALIGSITNTVLVVTLIIVTGKLAPAVIVPIGITYGSAEAAVAALISLAVVGAWKGIAVGRRRGASI
jgi:uncharacterized membrane protein